MDRKPSIILILIIPSNHNVLHGLLVQWHTLEADTLPVPTTLPLCVEFELVNTDRTILSTKNTLHLPSAARVLYLGFQDYFLSWTSTIKRHPRPQETVQKQEKIEESIGPC